MYERNWKREDTQTLRELEGEENIHRKRKREIFVIMGEEEDSEGLANCTAYDRSKFEKALYERN